MISYKELTVLYIYTVAKRQNAGSTLNLGYGIGFVSLPAPQVTALSFNGHSICGGAAPPPPPPVTTTVAPVTTTTPTTTVAPVTTTSGMI